MSVGEQKTYNFKDNYAQIQLLQTILLILSLERDKLVKVCYNMVTIHNFLLFFQFIYV